MKKIIPWVFLTLIIGLASSGCRFSLPADPSLAQTQNALAVEQTKLAIIKAIASQTAAAVPQLPGPSPTLTFTATVPAPVPTATPTVTLTPASPTLTPTFLAGPGFSNLVDHFLDPGSGWPEKTTGENRYWYATDHYHIQVDRANFQFVIPSGFTIVNGSVMTYGLLLDQTSTPGDYMGVVCRMQDGQNYYFFEISYDGHYRIGKFWNGTYSLIGMGAPKPSAAILVGDYNQIWASCINNELSLTVNNTLVDTVYDNTFTSGDTGLCASADDTPGVIAAFDSFMAEDN